MVKVLDVIRLTSRKLVYPFGVLLMSVVTLSNIAVGKQRLSQDFDKNAYHRILVLLFYSFNCNETWRKYGNYFWHEGGIL